jgi:hypothetical protein
MEFDDIKVLEGLAKQIKKSAVRAEKALDVALYFIDRSEKRIAKMELQHQRMRPPKGPLSPAQ